MLRKVSNNGFFFTRRDVFLLFVGVLLGMHLWSLLFTHFFPSSISSSWSYQQQTLVVAEPHSTAKVALMKDEQQQHTITQTQTFTTTATTTARPTTPHDASSSQQQPKKNTTTTIRPYDPLPTTEILAHAPGWTLFRNLYTSNGTLFVVADEAGRKRVPQIRMMVSVSMEALATAENIAAREPDSFVMSVISPEEAEARWTTGTGTTGRRLNRVWTVEGNTLLSWDPKQFLRHYYHFVAEFMFGVQAFWHGAFSAPIPASDSPDSPHFFSPSSSSPSSSSNNHNHTTTVVPPIHRIIFAYADADGWRDDPGFDRYFLRAVLPSLTVEHREDWEDRVALTRPSRRRIRDSSSSSSSHDHNRDHDHDQQHQNQRAFHFPLVLLVDRSAAFRGRVCGSLTQRTAAEAWEYMRARGKLVGIHVGGWWAPMREAMWRFAGSDAGLITTRKDVVVVGDDAVAAVVHPTDADADESTMPAAAAVVDVDRKYQKMLPPPRGSKIVITYVSRQRARHRKLMGEDHDGLVRALRELVDRKNGERRRKARAHAKGDEEEEEELLPFEWEFNELHMEKMSKDEQIKAAANTTFLLGVHGNGLSHLIFMDPNRYSTVIEFFIPGGFAHDYQWTTRALGMTHVAVWNDTHHIYPDIPEVNYPDGFQDDAIPAHGPAIAQLLEDRVTGKL